MRCKECNVDVSPSAVRCPLCGGTVCDDAAALPDLADIPYPEVLEPAPKEKGKITAFTLAKYCTRAAVAAGTALNIAGRIKDSDKLVSAGAALCSLSASASLAACLTEKGELMKGATPLLISTAAAASCALPYGKKHNKKISTAAAAHTGICLLANCAAYLSAPEKMREQYKAVFRITGDQK